jgi:hypothetical protein
MDIASRPEEHFKKMHKVKSRSAALMLLLLTFSFHRFQKIASAA